MHFSTTLWAQDCIHLNTYFYIIILCYYFCQLCCLLLLPHSCRLVSWFSGHAEACALKITSTEKEPSERNVGLCSWELFVYRHINSLGYKWRWLELGLIGSHVILARQSQKMARKSSARKGVILTIATVQCHLVNKYKSITIVSSNMPWQWGYLPHMYVDVNFTSEHAQKNALDCQSQISCTQTLHTEKCKIDVLFGKSYNSCIIDALFRE